MSKVVGIDLGTTNSLVACVKDGEPIVIRDRSGDALLPSIVSAASGGTIFVGREAQRRLLSEASRTVYSVKRFMGKGVDDLQNRPTWTQVVEQAALALSRLPETRPGSR